MVRSWSEWEVVVQCGENSRCLEEINVVQGAGLILSSGRENVADADHIDM